MALRPNLILCALPSLLHALPTVVPFLELAVLVRINGIYLLGGGCTMVINMKGIMWTYS